MTSVPLIGGVTEQKLIITFKKNETGEGVITFDFEPAIVEAISPEQIAAHNVARHVITSLGLDKAKAAQEQQNEQKIIQ